MKNLPVSFVDCAPTRAISRLKSTSGQSLCSHILSPCDSRMKEILQKELPSRFALVFDGWTDGTHHFTGIAASYVKLVDGKETACRTMLVSMKPLFANEIQGMRSADHNEHLSKVLLSYGKSCANIVCLVSNNCSVNQSIARLLNVPLLGRCSSHHSI